MKDRILFVLALMVFATMTHPARTRPKRRIAEKLLGLVNSRRPTVAPFVIERESTPPPFAIAVDAPMGRDMDERASGQPETGLVDSF